MKGTAEAVGAAGGGSGGCDGSKQSGMAGGGCGGCDGGNAAGSCESVARPLVLLPSGTCDSLTSTAEVLVSAGVESPLGGAEPPGLSEYGVPSSPVCANVLVASVW